MRLVHIFFDISMSNGHAGLNTLLAKEKKTIGDEQYAVFVNKSWMAMKMLTPNNVLLHYKSKSTTTPINPQTIKHLPDCVKGGTLDYSTALASVIKKQFDGRFER